MAEAPEGRARGEEWWSTDIIEMRPGLIRLRGYPIEDLIGRVSFPAMIWLMLRGDLPSEAQANLLGAALGAAVDGGLPLEEAVAARLDRFFAEGAGYVPGFGHRFHPVDPRAPRLLALVREAASVGAVSGRFTDIAEALEREIAARKGK